jgi:hypothetical protein
MEPLTMSSAQYEPDPQVLELINKARTACGMPQLRELPQGIPETSRQCVLGRSLGVEVLLDDLEGPFALTLRYRQACALARAWSGGGRPRAVWNGWAVTLPASLSQFIRQFDARKYPKLVSSNSEARSESIRSELRSLRFDWVEEKNRLDDLLERARSACDHARQLSR